VLQPTSTLIVRAIVVTMTDVADAMIHASLLRSFRSGRREGLHCRFYDRLRLDAEAFCLSISVNHDAMSHHTTFVQLHPA